MNLLLMIFGAVIVAFLIAFVIVKYLPLKLRWLPSILLLVAAIFLGIKIYDGIMEPIVFNKEKGSTIFKPHVRNKENKVYISKLSLNQEALDINVYYEDAEGDVFNLIYSETIIDDSKNISRVLSLDQKLKGTYKIVTKTEGRTFVDYIQF